MERQTLRSRARCSECGSKLPPRTEAWVEVDGGAVMCESCHRLIPPAGPLAAAEIRGESLPTPPPRPEAAPAPAAEPAPATDRPRIRRAPGRSATAAPTGGAPGPAEPAPDKPVPVPVPSEPSAVPVDIASADPVVGAEPEPAPVEPEPASVEPEPAQAEPEPAPVETEPTPVETEPEPEPAQAESEPEAAPGTESGSDADAADTDDVEDTSGVDAHAVPAVDTEGGSAVDTEDGSAAAAAPAVRDTLPGPLVAELPFADGAAPLPWKGELFQGPPAAAFSRPQVVEKPSVSLKFTAVVADLARSRPEATDAIGTVLQAAENRGLIWLPNRKTPGGFAVDHLTVTPNGIWVVVGEPPPKGRVERRDVGDWFTPEPRLYVGDDDQTHVIRRINAIDDSLRRAFRGTLVAGVPRFKVLCFIDPPPGWLDRPFPFDDVWVTWSHHLVEPMLATVNYQQDDVAEMAEAIDKVLTVGH